MAEIVLSIMTPTYNRGQLLKRCLDSLKKQTNDNFEWIIVDDGSTDETKEIVQQYITEEKDMQIQYVYKENGGKHTAMNASHPYIRGKYVMILDSDDYLTSDAVERIITEWRRYETNPKIGTLIFLRGDSVGNARAYGEKADVPGDYRRLKRINVTSSDCCEVFRSKLFIEHPYSEYKGERFLSESELWNRLAEEEYKVVYINKVVYICEYLEGGLTDSGRRMRIKNPLGGMCTSKHFFDGMYSPQIRIKKCLLYICYGYFAGMGTNEIINRDKGNKMMKILCLLPGYVMFRMWKRRYI